MILVPLSTNFLESVVDSKIEYLIVLFYDMFLVQLSTDFRNRAGLCAPPGEKCTSVRSQAGSDSGGQAGCWIPSSSQ